MLEEKNSKKNPKKKKPPKKKKLSHQLVKVERRKGRRRPRPRPFEPGPVRVAPAQRVRPAQRHDLAVVEPHPGREDGAEVLGPLRRVGQARVLGGQAAVGEVGAARGPLDLGAPHLLDGHGARQSVEVGVGDPGELLLDGLEQRARDAEARVGAVRGLRVEAHGGAVAASRARLGVVGARAVPGEADQHGAVGAVVVTLRVEDSRDGAPDGVVVSRGRGGRGGGRRDPAEQVVEEAVLLGVPEAGAAGDDEEGPGLLLLVLFGGGGRGEREGVRKKCQKKRGSRGRKEGRVVRGNHHRR